MMPSILRRNFIPFANQRVSLMCVGSVSSFSKVRSFGKEARDCIVSKPKRKESLEKIININKTLEENKRKMKEELDVWGRCLGTVLHICITPIIEIHLRFNLSRQSIASSSTLIKSYADMQNRPQILIIFIIPPPFWLSN